MEKKKNIKIYYEVMKIIACLAVIYYHAGGTLVVDHYPKGSFMYTLVLMLNYLIYFGVAIFFFIAGAESLHKEDKPLKIQVISIIRFVETLVVFSAIYYFVLIIDNNKPMSISYFLTTLYEGYINDHLWFLYAYIIYLISMPFLKSMLKNISDTYLLILLVIFIIFSSVIPIMEAVVKNVFDIKISLNTYFRTAWFTSTIIVYPCMGYYLEHRFTLTKKSVIIANVINIVCMVIYALLFGYTEYKPNMNESVFELTSTICTYLTIKYIVNKINFSDKSKYILRYVGKTTFGIYLIHVITFIIMKRVNLFNMNNITSLYVLNSLLVTIVCFVISFVITVILSKIPIIKKLVGYN